MGPIQVMAVGFGSEPPVEDRILQELDTLQGRGLVRLLDLLFVRKAADGSVAAFDVGDDNDYGELLAGFLDIDLDEVAARNGTLTLDGEALDLAALAEDLDPGTAIAVLLIEHAWASRLFDAFEDAGGVMLAEGLITEDGALLIGAEVEAMNEAASAIEAAQALEAASILEALAAADEARDAVARAESIKTAAAASAVQALVEAGVIEEAAAQEAADALVTAGLIEQSAYQEAAETVEESEMVQAAAVADAAAAEAAAQETEVEAAAEATEAVAGAAAVEETAKLGAEETMRASLAAEVDASLTKAERRVLDYLPTDMTFRMIADKLHISRASAKDRAARVYRKLGVHSRAEAVERIKELGLAKV